MFGRTRRQVRTDTGAGTPTTAARGRHAAGRRPRRGAALHVVRPPGPRATAGTRGSGRRAAGAVAATLTAALAVGAAAGLPLAADATTTARTELARARYAPSGVLAWRNDDVLGRTSSADQFVQATVSGLAGGNQQAGFLVRYADRTHRVRVSVSGTRWRIEPSGEPTTTGRFTPAATGLLRVEAVGRTVRLRWNGAVVATRQLRGAFTGRTVVATVRQARPGVVLRDLRAGRLTITSGTSAAHRPPAARTWLSGAASDAAANGTYGTWRRSPVTIGGTWDDSYDGQINQWTICGDGPWARWRGRLDLAFGAIYHSRGETWAAAARGAYDARWAAALTTIRTCWGTRDAALLYLRFAHEMNQPNDWAVRRGEEAAFIAAITRFSTLRYRILPRAKVVLCPNDGTDGGLGGLDVRRLWPGRDGAGRRVVDVYAVDSYNAWPHVTTAPAFKAKIDGRYPGGAPLGIEAHRKQARAWGVPFAIGEWSNNGVPGAGGGGESPVYVRQFNAWARAHAGDVAHPVAGQLLYEIHFNLWTQYRFWPQTRQPRTAAAYRALAWGR